MTKIATKKRRGRPAGSKNKTRLETTALPAICPSCGSAELKPLVGAAVRSRKQSGELPNGYKYTRIEWRRTVCECGQHVAVRTYFP